jgi:hypothetical protein
MDSQVPPFPASLTIGVAFALLCPRLQPVGQIEHKKPRNGLEETINYYGTGRLYTHYIWRGPFCWQWMMT